jgi:hypothetical protein
MIRFNLRRGGRGRRCFPSDGVRSWPGGLKNRIGAAAIAS